MEKKRKQAEVGMTDNAFPATTNDKDHLTHTNAKDQLHHCETPIKKKDDSVKPLSSAENSPPAPTPSPRKIRFVQRHDGGVPCGVVAIEVPP